MDDTSLRKLIQADALNEGRSFLPGPRCDSDDIARSFDNNILIDGLRREEAYLILSALPKDCNRVYLTPLDKGLSGSKVFAGKYQINGKTSKLFVFKIGDIKKIKTEHYCIEHYVSPYVHGIYVPVLRCGMSKGLIVQEFAGLATNSKLVSLKEHVRTCESVEHIIEKLLGSRLSGFYGEATRLQHIFKVREIFDWYLSKVSDGNPFPADWSELIGWIHEQTGCCVKDPLKIINDVLKSTIRSPSTIIHGDLHSLNVLVDENCLCYPIDFAWCRDQISPLLDLTMLECSLKFLAIPRNSDLRTLIDIENDLCSCEFPHFSLGSVPYRAEIYNIFQAVLSIRRFSKKQFGISFDDYKKVLCIMTYVHSTHPKLNRPLVLASLYILCSKLGRS